MWKVLAMGIAALFVMNARIVASERPKAGSDLEPGDLAGRYEIIAGEKYGEPETGERLKGTTVLITKERIVVSDAMKHESFSATYTLDSGTRPCRITMKSALAPTEGHVAKGLIEKKGNTLRLIYAIEGGDDPSEFSTKAKQMMFVMKSIQK